MNTPRAAEMEHPTFYYECEICQFEGELEGSGPPLQDANCPRCNTLLLPVRDVARPAVRRAPPTRASRWATAVPFVLIGAVLVFGVVALLYPWSDVWVYVDSPHPSELTVSVDGRATPVELQPVPRFKCRAGMRRVTITHRGATVFDESKELRRPAGGPAGKYLVRPDGPGFYYTFELEYGESGRMTDDLVVKSAMADLETRLMPADELFPEKKQAKLDRVYREVLKEFRKTRARVVEGSWLEVHDCHYVLQYPPGSARLKRKSSVTLRSVVAARSPEEAGRLKRVEDVRAATLEDIFFLGDFLSVVRSAGGSTKAHEE